MGFLRLFLALSVVVWHIPGRTGSLVHAGIAVILFFIISGFYMTLVLNERYVAVGTFYASRASRIFPAYLAMVATMLIWSWHTGAATIFGNALGQPLHARIALIVMNVTLVGQDLFQAIAGLLTWAGPSQFAQQIAAAFPTGFFNDQFMLVGQAWSLGSELLFYLIAPFVVRSTSRILYLFVLSVAIRIALISNGYHSEIWGYQFFPATLCFFLIGSAAYHLYARVRQWPWVPIVGFVLACAIALFCAASIWASGGVLLIDRSTGYDTLPLWLAYIAFGLCLPFVFARWKYSRLDRLIGDISYPLYLVHGLVLGIVFNVYNWPKAHLISELFAIIASIAAAAIMLTCIDLPVDAWRHARFYRGRTAKDALDVNAFKGTAA